MSAVILPELAVHIVDVVKEIIAEVRPRLIGSALSGRHGEKDNIRHADNFLSVHDMWLHERYRTLLGERLSEFVYASEEGDPEVIGSNSDPDLLILVDPLDTSELAVRGLLGYTHVMAYSRTLARPVVAVVGDLFHHVQLYVGARDRDGRDNAYVVTTDGNPEPIGVQPVREISQALVTNYLMRPTERLVPLSQQHQLIDALSDASPDGKNRGRIGVDFGSVGLCHVAVGFTDAMIEFAKGFAIWDLCPGHYILHAAGGTVIDLTGQHLSLDYRLGSLAEISNAMNRRQKFIAAGTDDLARKILNTLHL